MLEENVVKCIELLMVSLSLIWQCCMHGDWVNENVWKNVIIIGLIDVVVLGTTDDVWIE